MGRSNIRLWFAAAVAAVGAACADPLLEFASNAGFFGRGQFTDHSNLDVLPAIIAGTLCAGLYVALRTRTMLLDLRASDRALEGSVLNVQPLAFAMQLLVLFGMETLEQIVVSGHTLGGTVWLGAPPVIALAFHALTCILVAYVGAKAVRSLANAALDVVLLVRALAARPVQPPSPIAWRGFDLCASVQFFPVLCRIGERAPPVL